MTIKMVIIRKMIRMMMVVASRKKRNSCSPILQPATDDVGSRRNIFATFHIKKNLFGSNHQPYKKPCKYLLLVICRSRPYMFKWSKEGGGWCQFEFHPMNKDKAKIGREKFLSRNLLLGLSTPSNTLGLPLPCAKNSSCRQNIILHWNFGNLGFVMGFLLSSYRVSGQN